MASSQMLESEHSDDHEMDTENENEVEIDRAENSLGKKTVSINVEETVSVE